MTVSTLSMLTPPIPSDSYPASTQLPPSHNHCLQLPICHLYPLLPCQPLIHPHCPPIPSYSSTVPLTLQQSSFHSNIIFTGYILLTLPSLSISFFNPYLFPSISFPNAPLHLHTYVYTSPPPSCLSLCCPPLPPAPAPYTPRTSASLNGLKIRYPRIFLNYGRHSGSGCIDFR